MNSKPCLPNQPEPHRQAHLCWAKIDTVLLDLDGTLLDRHFDDYFWEQHIPEIYARRHGINEEEARHHLLSTYRSVESTLEWTDLDYWSRRLGLDFTREKAAIAHLVAVQPDVPAFLAHLRRLGKMVHLVTNAHPETLRIKMEQSQLTGWFDSRLCSREVGAAKEQGLFWQRLQRFLPYRKERTLFVDDTEKVLDAAAAHGIGHLLHVAKPSSQRPAAPSLRYPAIHSFSELLTEIIALPSRGETL